MRPTSFVGECLIGDIVNQLKRGNVGIRKNDADMVFVAAALEAGKQYI